jgi:hypothetical protein
MQRPRLRRPRRPRTEVAAIVAASDCRRGFKLPSFAFYPVLRSVLAWALPSPCRCLVATLATTCGEQDALTAARWKNACERGLLRRQRRAETGSTGAVGSPRETYKSVDMVAESARALADSTTMVLHRLCALLQRRGCRAQLHRACDILPRSQRRAKFRRVPRRTSREPHLQNDAAQRYAVHTRVHFIFFHSCFSVEVVLEASTNSGCEVFCCPRNFARGPPLGRCKHGFSNIRCGGLSIDVRAREQKAPTRKYRPVPQCSSRTRVHVPPEPCRRREGSDRRLAREERLEQVW